MTTHIGGEMGVSEKIGAIALLILFISFLIYIPFMIANKQERLQQAWQTQGCQMYDDRKIADIPVKCHSEFIDHYAPQEMRKQP